MSLRNRCRIYKLRQNIADQLLSSAYVDVDAKDVVLTWRPKNAADVELTNNNARISATQITSHGGQLVVNLRDPQRLGAVSVPKASPPVPSSDPSAPERHSDDDESQSKAPAAAERHSDDDSSPENVPGSPADAADAAAAPAAVPAPCVAARRPTVPTTVRHAAYPYPIAVADLAQAAVVQDADVLRSAVLKIGAPKALPFDFAPPPASASSSSQPPAPGQGKEFEIKFVEPQAASSSSGSGDTTGTKRKEPEASGHEGCEQQ